MKRRKETRTSSLAYELRRRRKLIETIEFGVHVRQKHIEEGKCRLASKCMEKLANAEALIALFPNETGNFHVRVDAGHIRFNADGYRWIASTPKIAKYNLIEFDRKRPVSPHSYKVTAQKMSKIVPISRERQAQINEARRRRSAAGIPDKKYTKQTLRQRVVGFA